ncbi:MAG: HPF/RaiA family ribosome-associated protein [Steroidobacteraceae bacterium]
MLVNSDHHIAGGEDLTERVQGVVEGRLERFDGRITRVEVHLSDLDGSKLGERDTRKTLRCMMQVRIGGLKPIAVSHEAPTLTEAIHVAADKVERAIEHALGKLEDTMGRTPPETQVASVEAMRELERTSAPSAATHSSPRPQSS